jgi:CRP/FNR family transcriptional regulator, cyclic AMP receptor protein
MSEPPVMEEIFARVPLLSRLSRRQRARLARLATCRAYRPGDVIVRQGDTSITLYLVLTGLVAVERESETGARVRLAQLGPAGFFGEMGLIDDEPRAASVVALEPTECALLSKWDFRNELRNDPDIALALIPVLNARIRELEAALAEEQAKRG